MAAPAPLEMFCHDLPRIFRGLGSAVAIGAGGRSHVFRVERASPIHADVQEVVALKVFGLHPVPGDAIERFFEAEKLALSRLRALVDGSDDQRCLRLVRFHETLTGTWRDRPIYAFLGEYFEDGTLSRWRSGRDRVHRADLVRIVSDIADALQFLHDQGEVHQDVKPDNVFIVNTPDGPRARLGDFGCTRPDGVHTESRTPLYAPDIGEPLDSGGRYDVFSLACLTAAMIKGRLEPRDRRYGRLSANVLEAARHNALVIDTDVRWYRDVVSLLLDATRPQQQKRPTAAQFAERFDRLSQRCSGRLRRRRLQGDAWRRVNPLFPALLVGAVTGALAVAAIVDHRARWAMPDTAEALSPDVIVGWDPGGKALKLADPENPGRAALAVPLPTEPAGWRYWHTQSLPLVEWDAAGVLWIDPARHTVRRMELGPDGGASDMATGDVRLPALPHGVDPDAPPGLCPVRGGVIRWSGRTVEHFIPGPDPTGNWLLRDAWVMPANITAAAPDPTGHVVIATLDDGTRRTLPVAVGR